MEQRLTPKFVSPLIALMADQVSALQQSGAAAERLDSNTELNVGELRPATGAIARRGLAADFLA